MELGDGLFYCIIKWSFLSFFFLVLARFVGIFFVRVFRLFFRRKFFSKSSEGVFERVWRKGCLRIMFSRYFLIGIEIFLFFICFFVIGISDYKREVYVEGYWGCYLVWRLKVNFIFFELMRLKVMKKKFLLGFKK